MSSSSSSSGLILGSSSGNCISCPNIKVVCTGKSVLVPQTCDSCAHCDDCNKPQISLALCVRDGKISGIVNHGRYLDRAIIRSQKTISENEVDVTLGNLSLTNSQGEIKENSVDLKLKFIGKKKRLFGLFDNMFYLEQFRARRVSPIACFSTEQNSDCCNGFVLSSGNVCPQSSIESKCLLAGKFSVNACCTEQNSCLSPCGSKCCNTDETCVIFDRCIDKNPFCFAPASLICQNCDAMGSCANDKPCSDGTQCNNLDFLCYPIGCPALH